MAGPREGAQDARTTVYRVSRLIYKPGWVSDGEDWGPKDERGMVDIAHGIHAAVVSSREEATKLADALNADKAAEHRKLIGEVLSAQAIVVEGSAYFGTPEGNITPPFPVFETAGQAAVMLARRGGQQDAQSALANLVLEQASAS